MPLRTTLRIPGETPLELELEGRFTLDQDSQQLGIEKLAADVDGALAETLKLEAVGTADVNRQIADLELQISSADMRGEGTLRYASFESPQIDTKLHLNRFSRALLAVAGPGAAQAEPEPESGDGDTPLPLNALRAIDTQADLSIDEIDLEGHKLLEFKALLRVKDGLAALNRVTGTLHGGELSMHANLNARQSVAALNTKGGLKGVDLAQAMAAAGVEPSATGRASLTWELHGRGNTVNALRDTLRGPLDLTTEQLVLTDLGIEQKLCSAVALVNQERLTAKFPATSSFKDLSAKVAMGGGKAQLQPLNAQLSNITLTGKGELDLASLDFDTVFKARLLPGLEELDPACRINERITSVKWPVKCKGNASGDPADWCSVDSGDIIEDLAEYELKRKASKELEDKLGDKADGLLKGLLGK